MVSPVDKEGSDIEAGVNSVGDTTSATSTTTPPTSTGDAGAAIQCQVTAINSSTNNAGSTQTTTPVWMIAPYPGTAPPLAPEGIPAPSADAVLAVGDPGGQTLGCDPDAAGWGGAPSFSYQWYRNGVALVGNGADTPEYTVQPADLASAAAFQCEAIGESAGGSVAKVSANLLTAPAPAGPAAPEVEARGADTPPLAYVPYGEGKLRPVCALPDGTLSEGCSAATLFENGGDARNSLAHAIAEDGSRVFWSPATIFGGPAEIFVRENPSQPQSALANGGASGSGNLVNGSSEVSGVSTTTGAFAVGQEIFGRGVAAGTTIAGVGAGTLTLSAAAIQTRAGTRLIASSECTEAAKACTQVLSGEKARFFTAAADGSRAIYEIEGNEGSGLNGGLFEYDSEAGTSQPIAKGTVGFLGASEDAGRIYFASSEALTGANAEGKSPTPGKANLYLHDASGGGSFAFVATLRVADTASPKSESLTPLSTIPTTHAARVSADGEVAAFVSSARLTEYDNTDANSGEADLEVYRYDAASEELRCVSCNPSGARPVGRFVTEKGKNYWAAGQIPAAESQLYFSRALSDNGNRLFFESFEPLVLRDTNGKKDVYEWEAAGEGSCSEASGSFSAPAGGCVTLISSGDSSQDSEFLEATPSGKDVFFSTGSSLVQQDPGLIDIYDARVGGGFAPPGPPQPPCEGEACQSAPPPPAEVTPASSVFQGAENLKSTPRKPRCAKGRQRVVRGGKAHCIKKKTHKRAQTKHGRAAR